MRKRQRKRKDYIWLMESLREETRDKKTQHFLTRRFSRRWQIYASSNISNGTAVQYWLGGKECRHTGSCTTVPQLSTAISVEMSLCLWGILSLLALVLLLLFYCCFDWILACSCILFYHLYSIQSRIHCVSFFRIVLSVSINFLISFHQFLSILIF